MVAVAARELTMTKANWESFTVDCRDEDCRGSRFGHVCIDPAGVVQSDVCWNCRERVSRVRSARASKAVPS